MLLGEERFPGRQGRLLFACLVAEQSRPVPRDELAEALWGEAPPATWEKALTVLVSKLRGLLAECGLDSAKVLTSAFGCYRLNLPEGTWVDVVAASDAVAEAEAALAADDLEQAKAVAIQAASLARPPFLPGEEGAWVDAKRRELTEILRRAVSCLAEACLGSGDAAEAAKWAEETIALEPYRETGYRHLMAAHAAAGNRAEALRVYERCRQLLATELGAYPSPETESIYRELLRAPSPEPGAAAPEATSVEAANAYKGLRAFEEADAPDDFFGREALTKQLVAISVRAAAGRRRLALAAVALAVAASAFAIVLVTGLAGGDTRSAVAAPRVALVLPRLPQPGKEDPLVEELVDGLHQAARVWDASVEVIVLDELDPTAERVAEARRQIRAGSFGLVIAGGTILEALAPLTRELSDTRFVYLDVSLSELGLAGTSNATGILFDSEHGAYLAGYLAGLMQARDGPRLNSARVVSVIGGFRGFPIIEALVDGFARGARRALPDVQVLTDYSQEFVDQTRCQELANRQIDAGSDIVFAAAGTCSLGALAATSIRGVWGVGVDGDRSYLGGHVLASAVIRHDRAISKAVRWFVHGTLPAGRDVTLGLDDDAVGLAGISADVPLDVREALEREAARLRRGGVPSG